MDQHDNYNNILANDLLNKIKNPEEIKYIYSVYRNSM